MCNLEKKQQEVKFLILDILRSRALSRSTWPMQQTDRMGGRGSSPIAHNYSLCVPVLHVLSNWANSCRAPCPARRQGPASVGLWDLHIGPWCFEPAEARRGGGATDCGVRACGAGENDFHARGDRRREGGPARAGVRGDRRRAVLDSFEQLQIDFQAKHICIRKTVLRAIWVSRGMCSLNRWIIFLELSCRNFSPLNCDLGHCSPRLVRTQARQGEHVLMIRRGAMQINGRIAGMFWDWRFKDQM